MKHPVLPQRRSFEAIGWDYVAGRTVTLKTFHWRNWKEHLAVKGESTFPQLFLSRDIRAESRTERPGG